MKRILIDTNIYVEAMYGNPDITAKLQKVELIGINTISMGELLTGFKVRKQSNALILQFEEFLDSPRVELFSINHLTANFYSEIYIKLKQAGTPIPTNDIWIAASAFEHGLMMFTLDKHFHKITGLHFY
ncbi:MAG: type II toxin-antitoxin system VapC family toxin [bacterium]